MSARGRLALGLACAAVAGGAAAAHDFWIQPRSFWLKPGEATSLAVLVGHGADRQPWRMRLRRIVRFASTAPSGAETDRRAALREGVGAPEAELGFAEPGEHVVVLETDDAFSSLPADRFQAYLREEGLTPALDSRRAAGAGAKVGTERYRRQAKALVQVGPPGRGPAPALRPQRLWLEILPEVDPYRPGRSTALPVRVLNAGRPLPGARVKLTDLGSDGVTAEQHATDREGRAVFHLPRRGAWEMGVVWTEPLHDDPQADFHTTFATLTFGFPETRR